MAVPIAKTLIEIEDMGKVGRQHQGDGYQWKVGIRYLGQNAASSRRSSVTATPPAARVGHRSAHRYPLPARRRQRAGHPGRPEDPLPADRAGCHPRLVVPAFGMKKDAIPGYVNEIWVQVDADKTGVVPRANAPSSAAATTASCPSSWK
jgi:cytochrome c oxidase subunit 2